MAGIALLNFLLRAAEQAGSHPAFRFSDRERPWTKVADRAPRFAAALGANGIADGDRVALLAHDSDAYTECFSAVWAAGAVVTPINHRLADAEVRALIEDAEPRVLVVDDVTEVRLPANLRQ